MRRIEANGLAVVLIGEVILSFAGIGDASVVVCEGICCVKTKRCVEIKYRFVKFTDLAINISEVIEGRNVISVNSPLTKSSLDEVGMV